MANDDEGLEHVDHLLELALEDWKVMTMNMAGWDVKTPGDNLIAAVLVLAARVDQLREEFRDNHAASVEAHSPRG